ncbi:hypothetical protein ACA910_016246 [Epithemia clementina (nom. ined.)]
MSQRKRKVESTMSCHDKAVGGTEPDLEFQLTAGSLGGGSLPREETKANAALPAPDNYFAEIREQDRYLPLNNISRIMKDTVPPSAKIAKDSKEAIRDCVSEFISFVTSEASDQCRQNESKTIYAEDLIVAISALGFDRYVEPLRIYLAKYRDANPRHGASSLSLHD